MTNYREEEMKLYVPELEPVAQRLEALGATLKAPRVHERNVRFENADGTMTMSGGVLRLRQDTRTRLTFKEGNESGLSSDVMSRFEAEVEVSDYDAMYTILYKLGFMPYVIYEKYRTTYELDDVEIVLDEMPYGNFVEMEGEGRKLVPLRDRLGLQDAPNFRAGYIALFERVRNRLALPFNDLTFENFKGIRVPQIAFEE